MRNVYLHLFQYKSHVEPTTENQSSTSLSQKLPSAPSETDPFEACMSFVPAPQQANAASAKSNAPVTTSQAASAAAEAPVSDQDLLFKIRTFDVYWVDKKALMYKDGIAKVRRILREMFDHHES
jgi:hypothetical protein